MRAKQYLHRKGNSPIISNPDNKFNQKRFGVKNSTRATVTFSGETVEL